MTQSRTVKREKKAAGKANRPKTSKGAKQSGAGEPKKRKGPPRFASQKSAAALADAKDHKRNNIGPSGQGSHRGKERRARQTKASGRPDVSSIGGDKTRPH